MKILLNKFFSCFQKKKNIVIQKEDISITKNIVLSKHVYEPRTRHVRYNKDLLKI